ncbi:MAG: HypC/HybG/HupF family hydrogenase formation chaperone [Phycisphaerales bacterium]
MCLAVPARIEQVDEAAAWVRLGDAQVRVSLCMTPQAQVGDWVLVHAGFAIQLLEEEDVRSIWEAIGELESAREGAKR